ncbi:hypothetical protein AQUSIP_25000 [Aquicella siphonis]|uniref:Methyltransferase domain-containing protein n=1 Tax=Aquicella siphonis TaxID=254247 RepID=A0A5E4PLI3_9COXI|nr:hypothetical protein [Aquicella siphonis]VVC77173.1 hypothetical protein AQUSIP_25000 [Aquicella siphonis]
MGRMHLFELEDKSWCPRVIRETTTDFLLGIYNVFNIYEPAYEKIVEILDKTGSDTIIDCCSGSGGPIRRLRDHLDKSGKSLVVINLTDKYPNASAFASLQARYPEKIVGHDQSLDASKLPPEMQGMRTFFSSFHHFQPDEAVNILQDAVNNQVPIAIFETTQRHPMDFIRALLSPILILLILPFSRRMTWKKFFFTYLVPVTPWTNCWDYIVSNLRTYSTKEMQGLIKQLHAPGYYFETGKLWSRRARSQVPYLIGYKL